MPWLLFFVQKADCLLKKGLTFVQTDDIMKVYSTLQRRIL